MQPARLAAISALLLFIAIPVWWMATHYFSTTCNYDKELHKNATCVDSVSELLANSDVYDGQIVVVSGEFGFPLEGHYLRDQISDTTIALYANLGGKSKLKRKCGFKGQLKGIFLFGDSGHLGHLPGRFNLSEIISLDESNAEEC